MPFWKKKKSEPSPAELQADAVAAFESGDMEAAFEKFLILSEVNPTSEGLYYLGVMLDMIEQKEQAEHTLRQSVELDSKNSQAWYSLAFVYQSTEKYDSALTAIKNAHQADSDDFRILNLYASLLIREDPNEADSKLAQELAKKACELTDWEDEYCVSTYKLAQEKLGVASETSAAEVEANQPADLTLELIKHVEQELGKKANINALHNIIPLADVAISVQTIKSDSEDVPTTIFTTGASTRAMRRADGAGPSFAELYMLIPHDWSTGDEIDENIWPWQRLQNLAYLPHIEHPKYARESYSGLPEVVSITPSSEPLHETTSFHAFLLLPPNVPLPPSTKPLPSFTSAAGRTVEFILAMPVYSDEYEFAKREGASKLYDQLVAKQVSPCFSPNRPSMLS